MYNMLFTTYCWLGNSHYLSAKGKVLGGGGQVWGGWRTFKKDPIWGDMSLFIWLSNILWCQVGRGTNLYPTCLPSNHPFPSTPFYIIPCSLWCSVAWKILHITHIHIFMIYGHHNNWLRPCTYAVTIHMQWLCCGCAQGSSGIELKTCSELKTCWSWVRHIITSLLFYPILSHNFARSVGPHRWLWNSAFPLCAVLAAIVELAFSFCHCTPPQRMVFENKWYIHWLWAQ